MLANKNTKINKKNSKILKNKMEKIWNFFQKVFRMQKKVTQKIRIFFILLFKEIGLWPEVSIPLCFRVKGGSPDRYGHWTEDRRKEIHGWKRLNSFLYKTKLKELCQEALNYI